MSDTTRSQSISPASRVSLTAAQLITLIAALLGGGGSVGFVFGNLLPRLEAVEVKGASMALVLERVAATSDRLATIIEMQREQSRQGSR